MCERERKEAHWSKEVEQALQRLGWPKGAQEETGRPVRTPPHSVPGCEQDQGPGGPLELRPPEGAEGCRGSADRTPLGSSSFFQGHQDRIARIPLSTTILKDFSPLPLVFSELSLLPLLSLLTFRIGLFKKYLFIVEVICRALWRKTVRKFN